jgi:hypothetical protein
MVLTYLNKPLKWHTYPAFPDPTARYFLGLDVGQRRDPSAIAVICRTETTYNERDPVTFAFRREVMLSLAYLERIPLGTEYHDVVNRVRSIAQTPELAGRCSLAIDATGPGMPVVELARSARMGCDIAPVIITGGERETYSNGAYGVPKRDLITRLQLMLECGELHVSAELREASVFVEELRNMRVKVSLGGHETFEHWRSGQHDDLVLAVALACWQAKRWRDINGRTLLF